MTDREAALAAVAATWRIESAAVRAALARRTGDLALAADLAQDAVTAAVEQWPRDGIPANPGAWFMTVARRRLADHARRRATEQRLLIGAASGEAVERDPMADVDAAVDDPFTADPTDELRLFFMCCHPALSPESQVALTLRTIVGLTTEEIARAWLVTPATMQQRIVRAKKTLRDPAVHVELPAAGELGARLGAVLAVVYAVFTEGHAATSGQDPTRPELCHDALRLSRRLARLAPGESEVQAMTALLELQASRLPARTDAAGEAVLLEDQDRSRWDGLLVERGLASLTRARNLARGMPGDYLLQAEIAACHGRARRPEDTDWPRIAHLYTALLATHSSPARELAHAVAVGRADGPTAGLALLRGLESNPAFAHHPYLHAAVADAHERSGDRQAARAAYERVAALAAGTALERTARARIDALGPAH